METIDVYMALLDEGVSVWRPAPAASLGNGLHVLLRPEGYDPDDEVWEYPPGSIVRCERRRIKDGDIFAAVDRVVVPDRQSA